MSVVIRKMDLSDIPFVYHEELKIFGKSLGEKTLYNEIVYNDMSRYYIVLVDGKRAGYIGSWLTLPNAEILNLFISTKYRGFGLGRELVARVVEECGNHEIEYITLEVRPSNRIALAMYESMGFHVVSTRKQYYDDGEDALLVSLPLGVVE